MQSKMGSLRQIHTKYCISLASEVFRHTGLNSVDPDNISQNVVSDQSLHCLPFVQKFSGTSTGSKRVGILKVNMTNLGQQTTQHTGPRAPEAVH